MQPDFFDRFYQLISKIVALVGVRRPAQRVVPLALSGAVMVWTAEGNIVVETETARELAAKLVKLADLADHARAKDLFRKGHRR